MCYGGARAGASDEGTVFGVVAVEHGEDFLPGVVLGRAVEGGEDEHRNLGAHAHTEQGGAAGQVQDLEQCAPDDDGGAYGVGEVEEALAGAAVQEALYDVGVFTEFCHFCMLGSVLFLFCAARESDLCADVAESDV